MAWSEKTQPTPANARKRLWAAVEALDAAIELMGRHGDMKAASSHADNARAWAHSAIEKATPARRARGRK